MYNVRESQIVFKAHIPYVQVKVQLRVTCQIQVLGIYTFVHRLDYSY